MCECGPEPYDGAACAACCRETYRVYDVLEFMCPCGRSGALLDVGIDFAWCQSRFRLLPKPKIDQKPRKVSAPKEKETEKV